MTTLVGSNARYKIHKKSFFFLKNYYFPVQVLSIVSSSTRIWWCWRPQAGARTHMSAYTDWGNPETTISVSEKWTKTHVGGVGGRGGCWWDGDEAVFFLAVVCCLSFIICCNFLLLFYIFLMSLNNSYRINLVGKVKLFSCVYIFLH